MSNKFDDTQLVLLRAASQRDDHCLIIAWLLAPPTGPNRGQAQKATDLLGRAVDFRCFGPAAPSSSLGNRILRAETCGRI
jgi:hypothetical protein